MIGEAQELVSSTILYYQMSIRIRLYLYQYFTINANLDTTLSVSIPNVYLSIEGIQDASRLLTKKQLLSHCNESRV